ncbi:MAG: DUF1553 domain-containing protein, partial [Planctomycetaceae bacterium]|nr:DUF1553 domain-containing protein [Planctomycetaceae bacterium]
GLTTEQESEVVAVLDGAGKDAEFDKLDPYHRSDDPGWKSLKTQLAAHLKQKPAQPATKARAFAERTKDRRNTFVHIRGVYNRRGEQVRPSTPEILPSLISGNSEPTRLDLARWLFHEDNPLTARVAVNRIWQHLFGDGLVSTPNDFGNKGARPTYPRLLDWLATEYRRLGWSRKELIRLIVGSSTYRMSSATRSVPSQQHLGTQLLWRQNSYRVPAETVRDLHLTAAGLLDRTIGRRGIRPPLPDFVTEVGRSVNWPESQGSERNRRGMYIFFKRTVPYPMLITFDAPDTTVSCSRRERTNTPLQALTLLNDPVFFECAQHLAETAWQQSGQRPEQAIEVIVRRCLGRPPNESEMTALSGAYADLKRLSETTDGDSDHTALTAVARIVLNLDEFITRD